MGYTHYWNNGNISEGTWAAIKQDVQKILDHEQHTICFEYDEKDKPAQLDDNRIRFNGLGDDGHETFCLDRLNNGKFQFCKTAQKPYDAAVTACLIVVAKHAPQSIDVTSDGFWYEWLEGRALCTSILDYTDEDFQAAKQTVWNEKYDARWEAENGDV